MAEQEHIIKKQVIEIGLSERENAFRIQDSFKEFFYNTILDLFDEVFSEIADPDEYIIFDKIQIDIDLIDPENIFGDFRPSRNGMRPVPILSPEARTCFLCRHSPHQQQLPRMKMSSSELSPGCVWD